MFSTNTIDAKQQTVPAALKRTAVVPERWALKLDNVKIVQDEIRDEDHEVFAVSMRDHVMPVMKKFKDEAVTIVKNLIKQKAWGVIVSAVKTAEQTSGHYAASESLHQEVRALVEKFKRFGGERLSELQAITHVRSNQNQIESLVYAFDLCGVRLKVKEVQDEVFLNHTLVTVQSQHIPAMFDLSYHFEGPKSVPDVEGNDTVFIASLKARVNHSEAVGVVCWKNYNKLGLH